MGVDEPSIYARHAESENPRDHLLGVPDLCKGVRCQHTDNAHFSLCAHDPLRTPHASKERTRADAPIGMDLMQRSMPSGGNAAVKDAGLSNSPSPVRPYDVTDEQLSAELKK